jgi:[ribosomal protein S18]-alanine N-acetyltransferase
MCVEDVAVVHAIDVQSFSLPWPENAFRYEVMDNPNARVWVAEINDPVIGKQVIGMICVWMVLDEAHVATLAVSPEHRQKGIGERMLLYALAEAKKEGAALVYLEVRRSNIAAQEMYKKHGFLVTGTRPHYYANNKEDALLMTLDKLDTISVEH